MPVKRVTCHSNVAAVLEHLHTDGLAIVPPQLAAVTSLRRLQFTSCRRTQFELTADALDMLLALPQLTSLQLPRLSAAGRQVAKQLRRARPGLAVQTVAA